MAKKISQLTQATQVKSDDVTVIVQDGETKKLPLNMMVTKQDIENKKVTGLAKLDEIEATYENDTYTPTITVKNKSSVKVGEGDGVDYSANVMDGHAKSAILTGQTLVNIKGQIISIGVIDRQVEFDIPCVKLNTNYFIKYKTTTTSNVLAIGFLENNSNWSNNLENQPSNGAFILNSGNMPNYFRISGSSNTKTTVDELMIIEYVDGMENWDIPYFDGMQSVKMPVLMTTGKNLFNVETQSTNITIDLDNGLVNLRTNYRNTSDFINVISGKTYVSNKNMTRVALYNNGSFVRSLTNTTSIQINSNENQLRFSYDNSLTNIQLEEGSVATTYEPYKSNILSTSEDVVLRGIGDVKDTLNCLTGEVTERIGEIVLDGSEEWFMTSKENWASCRFNLNKKFYNGTTDNIITNGKYVGGYSVNRGNTIRISDNVIYIFDEVFTNVSDFKNYLQQNPLKVQYELQNPVIKTVDLMPSGTHPSTTPYCWKNGHIQLSSSGLLPNLEYSVVTSRAGQINQNATMIVKNDKRIFDLEILLAGGLVNTTYQALTLQNQVETGLSKVSLNSETEPDYLLYHMIMKLIEEKAYKLDDLTEKVSVFYLYEKLSDEQFETIYSALYPFVEDEIVEEPVVEELPEVVEDEVIM